MDKTESIVERMLTKLSDSYEGQAHQMHGQADYTSGDNHKLRYLITKSLAYIKGNINKYVLQFSINGMLHEIVTADVTTTSRYPQTLTTGASRLNPTDSINLFDEISRINAAFVQYLYSIIRDMVSVENNEPRESYQMQMFMADSLYPPGWEHLNDEIPLDKHKEYRKKMKPFDNFSGRCGSANGHGDGSASELIRSALLSNAVGGDPVDTERRIMRYETIPFWQKTHKALDSIERERDVEIGSSVRDSLSQIRTWKAYDDRNRPISKTFAKSKHCWDC